MKMPLLVLPPPLQNRNFFVQLCIKSIREPGSGPSGRKRKQTSTATAQGMGSRGPFASAYNEGAIVSKRPASANLINQDTASTNHLLFPQQLPVLRPVPKSKLSRLRFCPECTIFHTNQASSTHFMMWF